MKTIPYSELTPELARAGCFVTGMRNDAYHGYEGISKSGLDLVHRSPAHYRYSAKREATRAMEIGTAIHTAILEPERFQEEYVLLRDVKDRRASEYKAAVKVHGSERVLVASEADAVAGMQESIAASVAAKTALADSPYKELSAFVEDPETGVLLRARFDTLSSKGASVDLKKTRNAQPSEFAKSVYNYRYHVQAAMYSHVYELITGEPLKKFWFLAVEDQPPHCAMLYSLDDVSLLVGHEEYRADLAAYAEAVGSGDWRGYAEPVQEISLPSWAFAQMDNDVTEEIY